MEQPVWSSGAGRNVLDRDNHGVAVVDHVHGLRGVAVAGGRGQADDVSRREIVGEGVAVRGGQGDGSGVDLARAEGTVRGAPRDGRGVAGAAVNTSGCATI